MVAVHDPFSHLAGERGDERHGGRLIVHVHLRDHLVARVPVAMVGSEDDERVVGMPGVLHSIEHSPDFRISHLDASEVSPLVVAPLSLGPIVAEGLSPLAPMLDERLRLARIVFEVVRQGRQLIRDLRVGQLLQARNVLKYPIADVVWLQQPERQEERFVTGVAVQERFRRAR